MWPAVALANASTRLRRVAIRPVSGRMKEPRLSHRRTANSLDFLRDAGRSAIADRKYLASYAGPHSKCLARAEYRHAPSFVVRPPASKHFDRQRSGGQIAGEALVRPTDCARSAPVEIIGCSFNRVGIALRQDADLLRANSVRNQRPARFCRRESGGSAPVRRHVREPR